MPGPKRPRTIHIRKSSSALATRSPLSGKFPRRPTHGRVGWHDNDPEKANDPSEGPVILHDIDLLAEEIAAADQAQNTLEPKLDLKGWRLVVVMLSIFTGLFLSFLDTSIVAVALATIASRFESFQNSSWVFTAYLVTYMAFGIILARLSDFLGLKTVEVMSMTLFLAFSAACGAAHNMTQLIVFRALQGIGGSGLYSMCTIIALAAVPPSKIDEMATYVSVTQAIAVVLGPILSGIITHDTDSDNWRWIFYLNLPLMFLALLGLLVAWPKRTRGQDGRPYRMSFKSLKAIDFVGSGLLLTASVMLIFSLQEAGAHVFDWDSGVIIESFIISGVAFIAFLGWEAWIGGKKDLVLKPIFPIRVAGKRVMFSAILRSVTVLNGFLWYLIVLTLPDRFQLIAGDNPTIAGVRLLPMVVSAAVGTFLAGGLSRRCNLTAYTTIVASAIQLLGYGLMTTLGASDSKNIMAKTYVFEVLLGLGFGMSIASTTILTVLRFLAQPEHTAVMQGCISQMRSLGGSIGLSISTIIFNHYLRTSSDLGLLLDQSELEALHRSPLVLETMDPYQQDAVVDVYAQAFRAQMRVATCVAAAAFVLSFGCLERDPPPPGGQVARRKSIASVNYG
ncbi:uncharacterized protein LTR77_003129 [Saxophila tyrrhenica]|uniref:Major facilitator superfamily (MFS) profile domain-containing protein n=1 Tax=Saxophila tyrrhenica TaxID=1690608 RepID=A0AAV9PH46_9PEZI|nr:hypothetical protein LTR77_003129 [Saxophila tyrrhenica]